MWQYDTYHSSIITAGNGGTKLTKAAFTIFFNEGTEKYELEQSLRPDEQMWIDMGKLIREHVPDKNGKMLPADLGMGSYEFRDLTNKGVGTLFEGKIIYDKTYGHVTYGCGACCGYNNVVTTYDPLGIALGFTADNGVRARYVCTSTLEDVSADFYNWSTVNTAIATTTLSATHTGVSIGSTTSNTRGYLESNNRIQQCPLTTFYPTARANVNPRVTIDSFSPNPIIKGTSASVHITINPSATVTLSIQGVAGGTGSATFGTSGNTTLQISQTTTVNILGGAESNGSADLRLSATYQTSEVAYNLFSVTTGACSATYSAHGGDGTKNCQSQVTVYDTYSLKEYCSACTFTCVPISYDSTFTPSGCSPNTGSIQGAGNQTLTSSESGTFAATDCGWHYLQIKTTIVSADGTTSTNYVGGTSGLKCTKYPNGSLCP